jgi:hypothetical protein
MDPETVLTLVKAGQTFTLKILAASWQPYGELSHSITNISVTHKHVQNRTDTYLRVTNQTAMLLPHRAHRVP